MSKNFLPDDYTPVHERIQEFRKDYPKGRIATEVFKWQDDMGVFRASVSDKDGNVLGWGTGHATREDDKFVGEKFYEKGETVAVGRALAFAGYGIEKGIASQEEVVSAKQNQPNVKDDKNWGHNARRHSDGLSDEKGSITQKQEKAIFAIGSENYGLSSAELRDWVDFEKGVGISELSMQEASNLIELFKDNKKKADKLITDWQGVVEREEKDLEETTK